MVAHLHGAPVPSTTVVNRRVAPFTFGEATGTAEYWLRTAPSEASPGYFPTTLGWCDPYRLIAKHDPDEEVPSVLSQESVPATYSGAALASTGHFEIDGVAGHGDRLMMGGQEPQELPDRITDEVRRLATSLVGRFGDLRVEWVHDGSRVWVVQLQQISATGEPGVIVAGEPAAWSVFDTAAGLEALRAAIRAAAASGEGIVLRGRVGITSHFGDLLRRAGIPSRLETA